MVTVGLGGHGLRLDHLHKGTLSLLIPIPGLPQKGLGDLAIFRLEPSERLGTLDGGHQARRARPGARSSASRRRSWALSTSIRATSTCRRRSTP
jgi:hypothetical protein